MSITKGGKMAVSQDTLYLIESGFADAGYREGSQGADTSYYCPYCATIEGVLALYPALARNIGIERLSFARPRQRLVDLIGEENQSLPRLILADDAPAGLETGSKDGVRFVSGVEQILEALSLRHGFPRPHF